MTGPMNFGTRKAASTPTNILANSDSKVWMAGRTFQLSVTYVLQRGKKAQTMRKNIAGSDELDRM